MRGIRSWRFAHNSARLCTRYFHHYQRKEDAVDGNGDVTPGFHGYPVLGEWTLGLEVFTTTGN